MDSYQSSLQTSQLNVSISLNLCEGTLNAYCRVFITTATIKAKYYPWILLFLFVVLGGYVFPLIAALIVGYFFSIRFMKICAGISVERVQSWENGCFAKLSTMTGFIRVNNMSNISVPQRESVAVPVQMTAFPGKGVAVGTNSEDRKAPEDPKHADGYNPNYDRVLCNLI